MNSEAVKFFADHLAQGNIDLPFVVPNKEIMAKFNELRLRAGGEIIEPAFNKNRLAEYYFARITLNVRFHNYLQEYDSMRFFSFKNYCSIFTLFKNLSHIIFDDFLSYQNSL